MKKLKLRWWDDLSGIICFEANFFQIEYTFLEIKNFEAKQIKLPVQRHYLELDDKYLDLKQFKVEVL